MAFAEVTVKIDGSDLAQQRIRVGDITLSQPMFGHHWFSVECLSLVRKDAAVSGGASEELDELRQALGKSLDLELRWSAAGDRQTMAFKGVVCTVRAARGELGAYSVVLEGQSPTVHLDGPRRNRFWIESSTQDVLQAICEEYGSFCAMEATTSRTYPFTVQHDETDFEFVLRLCEEEGLWAWYDGETFHIANSPDGPERNLNLRESGDATLHRFAVSLDTVAGKGLARAWDLGGDTAISKATDEVSVSGELHPHIQTAMDASDAVFAPTGDLVLGRHPGNAAGLSGDIEVRKTSWAGNLVRGEGESTDPGLTTGGRVEVGGMSAEDGGTFLVTEVTHHIQGDGTAYRNTFACLPDAGAAARRERARPTAPSLWGACVVDTQDPDGLGRVQVQFHHSVSAGLGDPLTLWVRLLACHSGDTWGAFVLPEIGDEVVVAALDGDLENLVVLGSVPNGSGTSQMGPIQVAVDAVGADEMARGSAKVFLTRSGNQIVIVDKSGEESIEISSPDGQNVVRLTLEETPRIELTTDGEVNVVAASNINVTSDADVAVKAAGKISLDSDGDIDIKSGGKISLESAADLKMQASGKADLQANTSTTVKGMEVKVEGGGTVTCNPSGVEVKGPLIRLN